MSVPIRSLRCYLMTLAVSVCACSDETDPYRGGHLAREFYPPLSMDDVQARLLEAERNGPDRIRSLTDQPCAITIWSIQEEYARDFVAKAREFDLTERSDLPDTSGDEGFDEGWAVAQEASVLRAQISRCRDNSTRDRFNALAERMLDVGDPVIFRTNENTMDTERGPGRRARIEILSDDHIYVLSWRYAVGG